MKRIRIQNGNNVVIWEKIDDNEPTYAFFKEDDNELKPIIDRIIIFSINTKESKYLSIPDAVREIYWPQLTKGHSFSEDRLCKNDEQKYQQRLYRLINENDDWRDVFDRKTGRGGGFRINPNNIIVENIVKNNETEENRPLTTGIGVFSKTKSNCEAITTSEYNEMSNKRVSKGDNLSYTISDDSLFISEFPPDGTKCNIGEEFKKTWTIRNSGNVVWHNRYMRCDTPPFHLTVTPQVVKMPDVSPGDEFSLNVTYKADDEGNFFSVWRIYDEKGNKSFPHKNGVYVTLIVERDSTNCIESSQICSADVYDNSDDSIDILNDSIADCADLIGCCSDPSLKNAIKCSLISNNSIEIDYQFSSRPIEQWPDFISAVFVFIDDVDMYKYCSSDENTKLHFEIENVNKAINGLQIELQTDSNRVVGNPYVIAESSFNAVDIPISYFLYSKEHIMCRRNIHSIKRIQNLCFVIKKEYIKESKGSLIVRNIRFL